MKFLHRVSVLKEHGQETWNTIEELRKGANHPKGNSDFISKNRRKI